MVVTTTVPDPSRAAHHAEERAKYAFNSDGTKKEF